MLEEIAILFVVNSEDRIIIEIEWSMCTLLAIKIATPKNLWDIKAFTWWIIYDTGFKIKVQLSIFIRNTVYSTVTYIYSTNFNLI